VLPPSDQGCHGQLLVLCLCGLCGVQEEVFKARLAALKREEEMIKQETARLDAEKFSYLR
jgi:hypothetical protein